MSSFDEALRRQEAERHSADARQRSEEDQRRRAAEAAVGRVIQLLHQFCQRLSERGVQPKRVELASSQEGLFHRAKFTPAGYVLSTHKSDPVARRKIDPRPTNVYLVTPEAQLWRKSFGRGAGFVPITVENLLDREIWVDGGGSITFGTNGEALVYRNGDPPSTMPLEEHLAACAALLIRESSGHP
jgi:hypothetical protein